MARNFYHILEANEEASPEIIESLFAHKRDRLQRELDGGDADAKGKLWALKEAYDTLSHPARRASYDHSHSKPRISPQQRTFTVPEREGFNWNLNVLALALLSAGLVGFGLYLGRSNKKDEINVEAIKVGRTADNDAARVSTERILVDGALKNQEKAIDTHGQVANRVVGVMETEEARKSRELEYQANAGTEQLRQEQQRITIVNEQLQWERQQQEQLLATQRNQQRVSADRMQAINLMIANGNLKGARSYASSPSELSVVAQAEYAERVRQYDQQRAQDRINSTYQNRGRF